MIDNIRLRKIGNGFTVRYHIQHLDKDGNPLEGRGYVNELYVSNKNGLIDLVADLMCSHIDGSIKENKNDT